MTVTRRKKFSYGFVCSESESESESLHLDYFPAILADLVEAPGKSAAPQDFPRKIGKRKLRRFQNLRYLEQLSRDENLGQRPDAPFEHRENAFSKLPENDCFWNAPERAAKTKTVKLESPFSKISSKLKRFLKKKRRVSGERVERLESEVLGFFQGVGKQVCVKSPRTSFDRFILHAVAQFHGLESVSFFKGDAHKKGVKIRRTGENWKPERDSLADAVTKLRR